jgi:hypothetical protein
MVWCLLPQANGMACDFVLGQAGMAGLDHGRAAGDSTASTLDMSHRVTVQDHRFVIADTANAEAAGFGAHGLAMGVAATRLAGRRDFTPRDDDRRSLPARDSLCAPRGVTAREASLLVVGSGKMRVLVSEAAP